MRFEGNDLYLVQLVDGEIHLVAEREEVEELLAKKMEDPGGYYLEILEKEDYEEVEKVECPTIVRLGFPPNFFDDPLTWDGEMVVEHAWTYRYIPYWVLFGGRESDEEGQNQR